MFFWPFSIKTVLVIFFLEEWQYFFSISGARFEDLAIKFGGKKSMHQRLYNESIDKLVIFFKNMIRIPRPELANYHKKRLER